MVAIYLECPEAVQLMVGILIHREESNIYFEETIPSIMSEEPQEEWLSIFTSLIMGIILILCVYEFILLKISLQNRCYFYPHFICEETEAWKDDAIYPAFGPRWSGSSVHFYDHYTKLPFI